MTQSGLSSALIGLSLHGQINRQIKYSDSEILQTTELSSAFTQIVCCNDKWYC